NKSKTSSTPTQPSTKQHGSSNPLLVPTSHPNVQKVQFSTEEDFTTKSFSTIALPPFGFFAKLAFPPCTLADKATYATVQMGREQHLNLNSDLVYINHSCVPSVIFDTTSLSILAGPSGLQVNQELTFFYPSTEWDMAQGFSCFCGAPTCRGWISGAKQMQSQQLEGLWLNAHIRGLLEEQKQESDDAGKHVPAADSGIAVPAPAPMNQMNGHENAKDDMQTALTASLQQAEMLVEAAKHALATYVGQYGKPAQKEGVRDNGVGSRELSGEMGGDTIGNANADADADDKGGAGKRRGVTSREMSGEMGGDTVA
ncbi:hypothetical protein LOCC1_G006762, partial [Lachnellula occidentalis]